MGLESASPGAAYWQIAVSNYVRAGDRSRHAPEVLRRLGFRVEGTTSPADCTGQAVALTAWIQHC